MLARRQLFSQLTSIARGGIISIVRSFSRWFWRKKFFEIRKMSQQGNTSEPTLIHNGSLPPLPVPPLSQTCEKYLLSVKPLLNEDEYRQTKFVVDAFRARLGKTLQQKLEELGKTMKNWLADWWDDVAYLCNRGPLPFLSNIGGGVFHHCWPKEKGSQIPRTALAIYMLLQSYKSLQRQEWPVSKFRKNLPMDMRQYYFLFSSARMPGEEKDHMLHYFLQDEKVTAGIRHLVIIVKGRFYQIDVLDSSLEPLTPPEIESQLYKIKIMSDSKPWGPCVGVLTTAERPVWKRNQDHLFSLHKKNREIVDSMNRSLFVLILDENSPETATELSRECIGGDCKNRWFDKGMQMIAFKNGILGNNCDHCHFEGYPMVHIFEQFYKDIEKCGSQWQGSSDIGSLPSPVELEFTIDSYLTDQIEEARQKYEETRSQICIIDEPFTGYGKDLTKKHSIHPDSFVQMAIQLAYYLSHKGFVATYETATTRQFHHGRTETVRTCTVESKRWVLAMVDPKVDKSTKANLLRDACKKHDQLMNDACDGQGIDRHLLGLKILAAQEGIPTPQIFLDRAWKLSGGDANFILSTSLSGYSDMHGGMTPMVHDGYGVFYTITNNLIHFIIATFKTSTVTDIQRLKDSLHSALYKMQELFESSKL